MGDGEERKREVSVTVSPFKFMNDCFGLRFSLNPAHLEDVLGQSTRNSLTSWIQCQVPRHLVRGKVICHLLRD